MKLHKKHNWYTKPRDNKAFRFMSWVTNSPESLQILLTMANGVAVFVFGALFTLAIYYMGTLFKIVFGVFFILALRNLYKYIKYKRVLIKTQLAGFSLNKLLNK